MLWQNWTEERMNRYFFKWYALCSDIRSVPNPFWADALKFVLLSSQQNDQYRTSYQLHSYSVVFGQT